MQRLYIIFYFLIPNIFIKVSRLKNFRRHEHFLVLCIDVWLCFFDLHNNNKNFFNSKRKERWSFKKKLKISKFKSTYLFFILGLFFLSYSQFLLFKFTSFFLFPARYLLYALLCSPSMFKEKSDKGFLMPWSSIFQGVTGHVFACLFSMLKFWLAKFPRREERYIEFAFESFIEQDWEINNSS